MEKCNPPIVFYTQYDMHKTQIQVLVQELNVNTRCIDNVLKYILDIAAIIIIVSTHMPAHTRDLTVALPSLCSHSKKMLLIYNQPPEEMTCYRNHSN
jgi:hypothetical protein